MPSPVVLDLEKLLAPISPEAPTGTDLREDTTPESPYYLIRDARKDAGSEERANPGDKAVALPKWAGVQEIALDALRNSTKDLLFSSYLTEALLRTAGVPGLRDGFKLTRELVERFWDKLYPVPDEDGLATKVAPIAGLNGDGDREGTLIDPIHAMPLTASMMMKNYTFANYTDAVAVDTAPEETKKKKLAAGATTIEQIKQSVADTPASFYATLRDDLTAALEEFKLQSQSLGKRCGHDTPSASYVRGALQGCLDVLKQLAEQKFKEAEEAAKAAAAAQEETSAESAPQPGGGGAGPAGAMKTGGPIRSREDALKQLESVSAYFRSLDPLNLLSPYIDYLVRLGRMPPDKFYGELIEDTSALAALFKKVGITPPES
jgi:type VI secretion system protein ImpA